MTQRHSVLPRVDVLFMFLFGLLVRVRRPRNPDYYLIQCVLGVLNDGSRTPERTLGWIIVGALGWSII